jgi:hypothetical protein
LTQYASTISEQLLADRGQDKPAPYTIEKPNSKLLLEIADLPRKCRLADAQAHRRPGDRPQFCHGNERSQALKVHAHLSLNCIKAQDNYALDGKAVPGIGCARKSVKPPIERRSRRLLTTNSVTSDTFRAALRRAARHDVGCPSDGHRDGGTAHPM